MMTSACSVCGERADFWERVDGFDFFDCPACGSIALAPDVIAAIDDGQHIRQYDESYWQDELRSANERAWSSSLARSAEAIYLCSKPVHRFIDIGSGDGLLLDSLSYHLPGFRDRLWGVEMFPPEKHTDHPGYVHASLGAMAGSYDCGVCVEVIEHLTPKMLDRLVMDLAQRSEPGSIFMFNTGLADFVRLEDRSYIDPIRRGHIVSYGLNAIQSIFERHQFKVSRLGNRNWAFVAEKSPEAPFEIHHRIWHPLASNVAILQDAVSGAAMYILARESLRVDA